jgi:acetylornithine deacetylase/succinyl-diaminopimelate desuccinylase-like protein
MSGPAGLTWRAVAVEAVDRLRRMIRFDTTNPPGNELPLARYLVEVLRADGIDSRLVQPTTNRGVVCARLSGTGAHRPILLTAHMDVVGVEREQWSVDPFGGEVRDGYVYGRGAIDDKGMLAANLMAFLLLKRHVVDQGIPLERDVIFMATSDEETGGEWGMPWVIENHPEFVDAEFAFNEGGRIRMLDGRPAYAAIQTAEKVSTILELRATGPGGHAAVPLDGNAVVRLARALSAMTASKLPLSLSPTTREFFGRLSTIWPTEDERVAMAALGRPEPGAHAAAETVLARTPRLDALLRDTLSATVLTAGVRHNVIPTEARALLSLRTLPDHRAEEVIAGLRALIDDPHVSLSVVTDGCAAPASSHESPAFVALRETLGDLDDRIVAVPYLSTGATESAFLRRHGVQCYGILPFPLPDEEEGRMHDHDERLSVDAFGFGVQLLYGTLVRLAAPAVSPSRDRSAKPTR